MPNLDDFDDFDDPPEPVSPDDIIAAHEKAKAGWADARVGRDPAVDPEQLLANPANPRIHPTRQQKAQYAILSRLGWGADVLVNQRTGRVIDGHMRIALAITHGQTVPVSYIDVDEKTEREWLAVYDAVGRMAIIDTDMYEDLVADFEDPDPSLAKMFDDIMPSTPDKATAGSDAEASDDALNDVVYGMVGWSETVVKASGEEIGSLTALHMQYRAENGGTDEGFVQWLIQSHLD